MPERMIRVFLSPASHPIFSGTKTLTYVYLSSKRGNIASSEKTLIMLFGVTRVRQNFMINFPVSSIGIVFKTQVPP